MKRITLTDQEFRFVHALLLDKNVAIKKAMKKKGYAHILQEEDNMMLVNCVRGALMIAEGVTE